MEPQNRLGEASNHRETATAMDLRKLVGFFKLLADETRLQILQYLFENGETHVRALCEFLKQSQPAVSHHLALLKSAELVVCRRDGKHNYYGLDPEQFRKQLDLLLKGLPTALVERHFSSVLKPPIHSHDADGTVDGQFV